MDALRTARTAVALAAPLATPTVMRTAAQVIDRGGDCPLREITMDLLPVGAQQPGAHVGLHILGLGSGDVG
jgi:hypothetical protein